jgi:rhamnosyltransferase
MRFALEEGFDWIWLFDADSAPRRDALERLLTFHEGLSPHERGRIQHLASLAVDVSHGHPYHGLLLTPRGFRHVQPLRPDEPYACTGTIWSGSLYRVEAIRKVGLPSPDYVLDWGEVVYGYDGERLGLRSWVVPTSVVDHNIDGVPTSWIHESVVLGPLHFSVMRFPPERLYYIVRNDLYFWLHAYAERSWHQTLRMLPSWDWMARHAVKLALLRRWTELGALLRGARDGLGGHLERRYAPASELAP